MSAADVAAEIHSLIMEHGLQFEGVVLTSAVELSDGLVELQFGDGTFYSVRVRETI